MERNEDNFCFNGIGMPEVHDDLEENLTAEVGGQWVAVFDGIGGLPRGEEASYLAAKTLLDEERPWTEQDEQNYETILLQMLKKINDNITSWRKDRKITKMGTTMSALKFGQEAIYGLSIGDSRIYRIHDGKLEQLSTDHTFRRPGHMKSALTEYLGKEHQAEFPENSFFCVPYKKGDRYLICSDGLTDMLEESKIKSRMEQPVEEAVTSLIEETIRMGADDNTTIILAEVESETDEVQNGSDAMQSKSDAVMGKQIEYIQDGAEITSEEWIMQLQQEIAFEKSEAMVGRVLTVLIEGKVVDEPAYVGRTYMDAPSVDGLIFVNADVELMSGDFVRVRVTGSAEYDLIGEIYDESAQ